MGGRRLETGESGGAARDQRQRLKAPWLDDPLQEALTVEGSHFFEALIVLQQKLPARAGQQAFKTGDGR